MDSTYPLAVGDEAWCLLMSSGGDASASGARYTLRGAARVRVAAIDNEGYEVEVIAASGGVPGHRHWLGRDELYATHGREHAAFRDLVGRYWERNGAPYPDGIGQEEARYHTRRDRKMARARWADDGGRP